MRLSFDTKSVGLDFDRDAFEKIVKYTSELGDQGSHLAQFDSWSKKLHDTDPETILDFHLILSVVAINSIYLSLKKEAQSVTVGDTTKALASIDYTHRHPEDPCVSTASYILKFAKI